MLGMHDHGGGNFKSKVKAAANNLNDFQIELKNILSTRNLLGNPSQLAPYKILILHLDSEKVWSEMQRKASRETVLLRVTNGHFSQPPIQLSNGVFVLHLINKVSEVTVEEWKEILPGLANLDHVKALINRENPAGLKHFFIDEEPKLPALGILCQGYLAIHAEAGEIGNEQDGKDQIFELALKKMGWLDFRKVNDSIRSSIRQDLEKKRNKVRQARWWLETFGLLHEKNQTLLQDEWKQFEKAIQQELDEKVDQTIEKSHPTIARLLTAIRKQKEITPEIVAQAYCAMP